MNDVWVAPEATLADHDAFVTGLALDPHTKAPLLAVASGENEPVRLVMASFVFFGLFAASSGDALAARLLGGRDPGARRLVELSRSLPLGGAPRLERLRFLLGPGSEVITFLCRRLRMASGQTVFVAAALGVRSGLLPATSVMTFAATAERPAADVPSRAREKTSRDEPGGTPALHAALASRWPSSARRVRFVWQTDADGICRQIGAPLAAIVGQANGDLVGKDLVELAPRLDPSGKLAAALVGRSTWSGLEVEWPITDAPGAVAIGLGAVPVLDRERAFAGFRGYGVIHLDRVVVRQPTRLIPAPDAPRSLGNVVQFPGAQKGFSLEDQAAFVALGAELRDRAGLAAQDETPAPLPEPEAAFSAPDHPAPMAPDAPPGPLALEAVETPTSNAASSERASIADGIPGTPPAASAEAEIASAEARHAAATPPRLERADNALGVLDRLALGLVVSRDNVPIFANRHLLDMLGFADEDALHDAGGLSLLFDGEPADLVGTECVCVRGRDGTRHPAKARMQRIDWDGLPATLITLQPVPDASPTRSLDAEHDATVEGIVEDMARRHADDRRRDQGELRHLRAILETATDGVAVIDAAGDIVSLNRSGEALFGRDRSMVVGRPFVELFAQGNRSLAEDYLRDLTTDAPRSLFNDGREILVRAPQDGTIPVFMTLGRLDTGEQPTADARYCALFRDLTHWKKVEAELDSARRDAEAASAAKTDFLAKVSHEIRTPLNAIIGFAEVILEERFGPVGSERYRDYLRDIHTSGAHVMSLVNDLLDLSKIEAGRMQLDPAAIDANKIITECVGLMQPQASRERVIMRLSLAPRLPMIRADERSLRQIVLNLLSNAVKYNEPGGQVIVATAAPEDGKVVIRVRDTGAGMSEDDIAAALEPFRQVSTRPLTEGTGLGLPLTKALVEANEARFLIRSKLDHGTLVEVAFPPARVLAG